MRESDSPSRLQEAVVRDLAQRDKTPMPRFKSGLGPLNCPGGGMVYAEDLKNPLTPKGLWVRLPPRAPISNFPIFARPIRPREARKGMETLARRARRGSLQAQVRAKDFFGNDLFL